MQLHLTIEEFEILKSLVEDEEHLCCDAVPSLPQPSAKTRLQDRWEIGRDLPGMRLSRNLQWGFDELEQLAASLARRKKQLTKGIHNLAESTEKDDLERQFFIVEHLLERVTEACAML